MFGSKRSMAIAALLTTFAMAAVTAAPAEAKKVGSKSRKQVEKACTAAGGIVWGTGKKGSRYGCITDNAWIECSKKGSCTGGTAKRSANRKSPGHYSRYQTAKKPQLRK